MLRTPDETIGPTQGQSTDRQVILGISADLHDAAAALIVDGRIVAAAEEERFTRRKHEPELPEQSIAWALEHAGIRPGELATVVFHDKPLSVYERILVTHANVGPRGYASLGRAIGLWSRKKLWIAARTERLLRRLGHPAPTFLYAEHHLSHAAAAFYPSPFEDAAILTFDGVGEWATSSIGYGSGRSVDLRLELDFPDSLGLLYSTITAHCGFQVNDGEYKLMGLAPYGTPRFADVMRSELVEIYDDGSFRMDQRWFDYRAGDRMARRRLDALLGGSPRPSGTPVTAREADLAASMQAVLAEIVLRMAHHAHEVTGARRACLGGGVALNCVANARLLREGPFDEVWVQPAAGDAGSAVGAALWAWHQVQEQPRVPEAGDAMSGCQLGPSFSSEEIEVWLESEGIHSEQLIDERERDAAVAQALDDGAIVGWFQGRMEFGPRALGNRSILADPRRSEMVARINDAVKGREGFRPFAPAVLAEDAEEWFDVDRSLPYMLFTAPVHERRRLAVAAEPDRMDERLGTARSTIPSCTHVDWSARVQTVDPERFPTFHGLLSSFKARTGCPVLLNTSFNRRDEPIVRSPADAVRCFAATDLDLLVLEDRLIRRSDLAIAR